MTDARQVLALEEIRAEFTSLHDQAGQLMAAAHRLRPTLKLLMARQPLTSLEARLDECFAHFMRLDADLIQHANAPSDINTAMRNSAQFSFHTAVRDSVRGLLTDAAGAIAGVRTRLDFLGSLLLSILALLVAVVAIVVDAAG